VIQWEKYTQFMEDDLVTKKKIFDQRIIHISKNIMNADWPEPWPLIVRSLRLVEDAANIRQKWWDELGSKPFSHTLAEANLLHDKLLLSPGLFIDETKEDISVVYSDFFFSDKADENSTEVAPPINLQDISTEHLPIAIEYIDGFAIAFNKLFGDSTGWKPIPIRGKSLFDYDCSNISLTDELTDLYEFDPEILGNKVLLYVNYNDCSELKNIEKLGSLKIQQPALFRYDVATACKGAMYIDLTIDRLSIGITLRGNLYWRFFPNFSLSNWLRHVIGEFSPEVERAAKEVLLRNESRSLYSANQPPRDIKPSDLRISDYLKFLLNIIPDSVERVLLSGWLNTSLSIEEIKNFQKYNKPSFQWVYDVNTPLSLWKHCLIK
jgi:hypothetical protein